MRTKTIALLFGMLAFTNFSFAQEDESAEKVHKNEFALNIRQMANVVWGFPTPPLVTDPYMLQYRRYIKEVGAVRIGAGLSINNTETKIDTAIRPSNSSAFDFRVGWQFNEEAGKRFLFYYGADLFAGLSNSSSKYHSQTSGYTTIENTSQELGIAPLLGVQFYITPRVSLGTEASFRIASIQSTHILTYEFRPQNNIDQETTGVSTVFWPPSSLYLNIRF